MYSGILMFWFVIFDGHDVELFFFFCPHLEHMEAPRLGVKSELQLPAYATATATQDLRRICNLCHSLQQHQILIPLSEALDQTHSFMDSVSGS